MEQKIFLSKYLIWGLFSGFILGMIFPLIGIFFETQDGGTISRHLSVIFFVPMSLVVVIFQPVFELEAEKAFYVYIFVTAVLWVLAGLLAGYLFFKWKNYRQQKNDADISPDSRKQSNWWIFVVLVVLFSIVLYAGTLYVQIISAHRNRDEIDQKRSEQENIILQKRLDGELAKMEVEKQKVEIIPENTGDQGYFEERNDALSKMWQTDGKWKRYTNKKYGFAIDLPSNWSASEFQKSQDFVEIKITNENLSADIRNDFSIWLVAAKKDYIPDSPTNGAGTCAVDFDDVDRFCKKGCKKLNSHTAIDYRIIYEGEPMPSMQAYSTASSAYPSICLDIGIYDEINTISQKEGISQEEVVEKYAQGLLDGSDAHAELKEAVQVFQRMAGSISSVEK
ncbi:MAG: hypothetical protein WC819_03580 [Parcubacteria group bacterium]|jgi:hypothetical protein